MAGNDPAEFRAYEDELYSCLAGFAVDLSMLAMAVVGVGVFVLTGSVPALVGGLMMGNAWAREVGNRPCKARW